MRILCVGANHKTAPVSVRERLAFDEAAARAALARLRDQYSDAKFAIVSTCNRCELYAARPIHGRPREHELRALLGQLRGVPQAEYEGVLYTHADAEAVRHLFTVAAGLDSLVPGEDQILAQLKGAYRVAEQASAAGATLNELFQLAFNVAKHVRADTRIAAGKVSVASVAVELAREVFGDMSGRSVLSIGAGKMNALMLRGLGDLGARRIVVTNRSPERAKDLAEACGGETIDFDRLDDALAAADIVVCSTASDRPILSAESVAAATGGREVLIIDIAVPRDVEAGAGELDGVRLYNVDDLKRVVEKNIHLKAEEIDACRAIVDAHVREYFHNLHVREVAPSIEALYQKMRAAADEELAAIRNKLTGDPDADERLARRAFHRAVRRILHVPVTRLRAAAGTESARQQAAALRKLFDLDGDG